MCFNLLSPEFGGGIALVYEFARYLKIRGAWGASWSADGRRVSFLTEITGVPQAWEVPAGGGWPEQLTFHQFLVRLGGFGGYAVVETDSPNDLQYLCTTYAPFAFAVEPVLDVMDAVAAESKAIEWRESLTTT